MSTFSTFGSQSGFTRSASGPDAVSPDRILRLVESGDSGTDVVLTSEMIAQYEPKVRMALMARYGTELGDELAAEAMAWAWENRERLAPMANPIGYLIRVGQSRSRRHLRWRREQVRYPVMSATTGTPWSEPALPKALAKLDPDTRTAIVLVHCFQWTYPEVCELLEVPLHTVRNRIHRGLRKLRDELGVNL